MFHNLAGEAAAVVRLAEERCNAAQGKAMAAAEAAKATASAAAQTAKDETEAAVEAAKAEANAECNAKLSGAWEAGREAAEQAAQNMPPPGTPGGGQQLPAPAAPLEQPASDSPGPQPSDGHEPAAASAASPPASEAAKHAAQPQPPSPEALTPAAAPSTSLDCGTAGAAAGANETHPATNLTATAALARIWAAAATWAGIWAAVTPWLIAVLVSAVGHAAIELWRAALGGAPCWLLPCRQGTAVAAMVQKFSRHMVSKHAVPLLSSCLMPVTMDTTVVAGHCNHCPDHCHQARLPQAGRQVRGCRSVGLHVGSNDMAMDGNGHEMITSLSDRGTIISATIILTPPVQSTLSWHRRTSASL